MSIGGAFSIAKSGLADIGANFAVMSQNIANANTPGYAREVTTQTSIAADGGGVKAGPTTRQIDTQLESELFSENGTLSALQTRLTALQQIDAVQGTPGGGGDLASLIGQLQDSFANLQTGPSNQASQAEVVNAASALTSQINALSNSYTQGRQNAQDTIMADVGKLNSTLATIGSLSDRIVGLKAAGQGTADLENQRAQAMQSLSQVINVRFIEQPNGDMLAATTNGLSLPLHAATPPLATQPATIGAGSSYPSTIPAITLNGADVTSQLTGGEIGAAVTLRDTTLPTYQGELDEFAETLSNRFDQQGLTLFTNPDGTIPPSGGAPVQSGYVGYAASITVNPAVAANPSLVRDGTHAVAGAPAGASAFTPNPAGGPAGFSATITRVLDYALGANVQDGVPQPAPVTSGLGPNGNLSASYSAPADLQSFATAVVATESSDSAAARSQATTEQAVQTALQSKVSASGAVSIDSEMSNMVQLQNAYAANAKVISALQSVWTELLQMVP